MDMDHAEELYRSSLVIDLRMPNFQESDVGLEMVRKSGMTMGLAGVNDAQELIARKRFIDEHPDTVRFATTAADIEAAREEGTMAVMYSLEHPTPLEHACSDYTPVLKYHLTLTQQLYDLGLRAIQLTYNRRTMFGDGCTERTDCGLSWYGVDLVEKMDELGMLLQLSHCGERTTLDAIELSKNPVCISHSGCKAVYDHPRSKSDEVIRAMAKKGGVIGIYVLPFFVSGKTDGLSVNDVIDHIDHVVRLVGIDHVAIGTDLSLVPSSVAEGQSAQWRRLKYEPSRNPRYAHFTNEIDQRPPRTIPGLGGEDKILNLTRGLVARGYADSDIKKILGENALRVIRDVCG